MGEQYLTVTRILFFGYAAVAIIFFYQNTIPKNQTCLIKASPQMVLLNFELKNTRV